MNVRIVSLAALIALLPALAAADQVYKWTDEQGHVHFSQTPPASSKVQAQQVQVNVAAPDPQSLQNQQQLVQQQADKDKAAKAAADQGKPDPRVDALKQQHCDDLRMRLQALSQSGRATTTDSQGNVNYLDDSERQQQEDSINKELSSDCKGH